MLNVLNQSSLSGKLFPMTIFKRYYPKVWPVVFLVGGIVSVVMGIPDSSETMATMGHGAAASSGLFSVLGAPVGLHDLMWFIMAAAHMETFWGTRCVCRS